MLKKRRKLEICSSAVTTHLMEDNLIVDAYECKSYDRCQRTGSTSKRHKLAMQGIIEVEIFDY